MEIKLMDFFVVPQKQCIVYSSSTSEAASRAYSVKSVTGFACFKVYSALLN